MLAFGAGGLDVAVAMGGGAYYIPMPKMVRVNLVGKLSPWVSAKDVILDVLRQMTVKGRCRQDRRVRRRGRKDPVRTGACHHHQHGR